MMDTTDPHLTYDDLLKTLVDASDLDPHQQAHFESCARCRKQAQDLKMRYSRLGKMAKDLAPKSSGTIRVSDHRARIWRWQFKPAMALGVLGFVIFVFTMWPQTSNSPGVGTPLSEMAMNYEDDDQLMTRVDELVKDALPRKYQHVVVITDPILSEDLIDWIVPSIDSV